MRFLAFERLGSAHGGRRLRRARFEERSLLPLSAACLVGNAMRETLGALFGSPLRAQLREATIPKLEAWPQLLREARLFTVRGSVGYAAIVLRPSDAQALAAAAFGERPGAPRALSAIEGTVLDRVLRALAGSLASVCGTDAAPAGERAQRYSTYFEVLLDGGVRARIGVALADEPACEPHGALALRDLGDVELELRVSAGDAALRAEELLRLQPGAVLPMITLADGLGTLRLEGRTLARGACGVSADRYALRIVQREACR